MIAGSVKWLILALDVDKILVEQLQMINQIFLMKPCHLQHHCLTDPEEAEEEIER